jgi:hypothetical protein
MEVAMDPSDGSLEPQQTSGMDSTFAFASSRFSIIDIAGHGVVGLLNLNVSLEWNPGTTDRVKRMIAESQSQDVAAGQPSEQGLGYVDDLKLAFERAASYLFYLTDGRFSLGEIEIHVHGANRKRADVCILANAAYRPAAFIGGIVDKDTPYQSRESGRIWFQRRPILLGRFWNGLGASRGPWSEPAGWRTIVHEIAHYALFLFDQYYIVAGAPQSPSRDLPIPHVCGSSHLRILSPGEPIPATVDTDTATAMAYHYTADKLQRASLPCGETPQKIVHGMTEWETIMRMYALFGITDPGLKGDELHTLWATKVRPSLNIDTNAINVSSHDTNRLIRCTPLDLSPETAPLVGQSYLHQRDENGTLERIIGQGNIVVDLGNPGGQDLDQLLFVSTTDNDQAVIIVPHTTAHGAVIYRDLVREDSPALNPSSQQWCPTVFLKPVVILRPIREDATSGPYITAMAGEIHANHGDLTQAVEVWYCPFGQSCQRLNSTRKPDEKGIVRFEFEVDSPSVYGYIHLRGFNQLEGGEPVGEPTGETTLWYQLAGGVGPASIEGHPPLAEGLVNVEVALQNIPQDTNIREDVRGASVLYSEARFCFPERLRVNNSTQLIGIPLYIQVALANRRTWGELTPPIPLVIRINYDYEMAERWFSRTGFPIPFAPERLRLVRYVYNVGEGSLEVVTVFSPDPIHNALVMSITDFAPGGEFVMLGYDIS